MKIPQFEGIINVITTPFDADGAINYDVLEQHIEFVIAGGVHAILPGGSTGEYYAQSFAERRRVLGFVADKVRGRLPLYAGTNSMQVDEIVALAGAGGRARATRRSCWPPRPTPCRADRNWSRISATWRCARHCRSSSTTSRPAPASTWISTFSRVWPTSRRSARSRNRAAASGACCSMSCVSTDASSASAASTTRRSISSCGALAAGSQELRTSCQRNMWRSTGLRRRW